MMFKMGLSTVLPSLRWFFSHSCHAPFTFDSTSNHMGTAHYFSKVSKQISKKQIVVNSMASIVELVKQGAGVAAVPLHAFENSTKHLHSMDLRVQGQIYLAYWKYESWPRYMKEFFDILEESKFKS
jgi:DNA-binding transcriptional LysR family regulator